MFEGLYVHCGASRNPTACFFSFLSYFFRMFCWFVIWPTHSYAYSTHTHTHTHTHIHVCLHSVVFCCFLRLLPVWCHSYSVSRSRGWFVFFTLQTLVELKLHCGGVGGNYSSLSLCQFLLVLSGIFFLVSGKKLSFFLYRFLWEGPLPESLCKFCFWLKSIFSYIILINVIYPCACAYLSSL